LDPLQHGRRFMGCAAQIVRNEIHLFSFGFVKFRKRK